VTVDAERVLTQRELNRAVLARQLLLGRAGLTVPRAVEQVAGVQAQYAPSMYVGLWSRLRGFVRDDLTRALEKRSVVQGTLMRSTIHLVSARDYWPFALGIRAARRAWWLRVTSEQVAEQQLTVAAQRLRRRLGDQAMHRRDVEAEVGKGLIGGVGLWIDLVRVPPSGTWERRRADLYADAERWLGVPDPAMPDAVEHLVRRYLQGFGPARRRDIANWAGLPVAAVTEVLRAVGVRRFRDESGAELVDLPDAPVPDPDTPAPVRFLPTWDATLLGHARRAGILAEEYRSRIFNTKAPQSFPTFLVDGAVAGTWKYEPLERIELDPFQRLGTSTLRQLREEADALTAFHA
jgi:hypothetical protein